MFRACHKCNERTITCHSTCPKYIEEKKENDERLDRKKKASISKGDYCNYVAKTIWKYKKRANK